MCSSLSTEPSANSALSTGCAPTLLPIHHVGDPALSPFLLPQLHKSTSSSFSAGLSQAPQWGSQEPSLPATCDHCGPRPTMLQFPDALELPPVPKGQCGEAGQGRMERWQHFYPSGMLIPEFSPFCSTSAGTEATPVWDV